MHHPAGSRELLELSARVSTEIEARRHIQFKVPAEVAARDFWPGWWLMTVFRATVVLVVCIACTIVFVLLSRCVEL